MAYRTTKFDGVTLPEYEAQRNFNAGAVDASIIDSVGGAFDYHGSNRRLPRRQLFDVRGKLVGETLYLVDHSGNKLVDHSGNYLIAGSNANHLRGQILALQAKIGIRGTLTRVRLDDATVEETKICRLLDVQFPQRADDRNALAELTCIFETTQVAWRMPTQQSISKAITAGTFRTYNARNGGGVQVDDAILTITRTSGTITTVTITGTGVAITWTGSLGAGDVLVMDAGAQTVKENGVDAYSTFSLGGGHTVDGFFPLPVGLTNLEVNLTGGNGTAAFTWYEQWP